MSLFSGMTCSDERKKESPFRRLECLHQWPQLFLALFYCKCLANQFFKRCCVFTIDSNSVTAHLSPAIPHTQSSSLPHFFSLGGLTMSWLYPTEVVLPRKMSSVEMESLKSLRAFWQKTITQSRRIQNKSASWGWIQSSVFGSAQFFSTVTEINLKRRGLILELYPRAL